MIAIAPFRRANPGRLHKLIWLVGWVAMCLVCGAATGTGSPATNHNPSISGRPPPIAVPDEFYSFTPRYSDPDGDPLEFWLVNSPDWLWIDPESGRLGGTPRITDAETVPGIVIAVTDGRATVYSKPFTITVSKDQETRFILSGQAPSYVQIGNQFEFSPRAAPDSGQLAYRISGRPDWTRFSRRTGYLTGVPDSEDLGVYRSIVIEAVDKGGTVARLPPFSIVVGKTSTYSRPAISGNPPRYAKTGQLFDFTPITTDEDGGQLHFKIANKPHWARVNQRSGRLWGKPDTKDIGVFEDIIIRASDSTHFASLGPFTVEVASKGPHSIRLAWNAPTLNTDGSAIGQRIRAYTLVYGQSPDSMKNRLTVNNPANRSIEADGLFPGTVYFAIRAVGAGGQVSRNSNVVTVVLTGTYTN
jgi:hypothetical protein